MDQTFVGRIRISSSTSNASIDTDEAGAQPVRSNDTCMSGKKRIQGQDRAHKVQPFADSQTRYRVRWGERRYRIPIVQRSQACVIFEMRLSSSVIRKSSAGTACMWLARLPDDEAVTLKIPVVYDDER